MRLIGGSLLEDAQRLLRLEFPYSSSSVADVDQPANDVCRIVRVVSQSKPSQNRDCEARDISVGL
jgi:hypothetical protein